MFPEILTEARSLVLERIASLIKAESKVSDSMLYTSTAESKMIRSALLIAASKKNTALTKLSAINLATSIELLHSYSLIHDDLPSMDNDNIRRGKDSNHIKYGEAIAILSGDALQTLAFEVITNDHDLDGDLKVTAISLLTNACGYKGMVLGQELDITADPIHTDEEFIKRMHYLKTGKLIEISLVLGSFHSKGNTGNPSLSPSLLLNFPFPSGLSINGRCANFGINSSHLKNLYNRTCKGADGNHSSPLITCDIFIK